MLDNRSGVWMILFDIDGSKKFWIGSTVGEAENIIRHKITQLKDHCFTNRFCYDVPESIKSALNDKGFEIIKECCIIKEEPNNRTIDVDYIKYCISKYLIKGGYEPFTQSHERWMNKVKSLYKSYDKFPELIKDRKIRTYTIPKERSYMFLSSCNESVYINKLVTGEDNLEIKQPIIENKGMLDNYIAIKVNDETKQLLTVEAILRDMKLEELVYDCCINSISDKAKELKDALVK